MMGLSFMVQVISEHHNLSLLSITMELTFTSGFHPVKLIQMELGKDPQSAKMNKGTHALLSNKQLSTILTTSISISSCHTCSPSVSPRTRNALRSQVLSVWTMLVFMEEPTASEATSTQMSSQVSQELALARKSHVLMVSKKKQVANKTLWLSIKHQRNSTISTLAA